MENSLDELSNNKELNPKVSLLKLGKELFPLLKDLTPQNRLKFLANNLEIQDYQENHFPDFRNFWRVYLKIENNSGITREELTKFQGSLTFYKQDEEIWKYLLSNDEKLNRTRSVLMKAILLNDTKNNINDVLKLDKTYGIKPENARDFDEIEAIIIKTAYENKDIDSRANNNYARNILFFEKLNMPANYTNLFYDFADTIELYYRTKSRKNEQNKFYPKEKELSSNHLLRVNRFGLGIMAEAWQNPAKFSTEDQRELEIRKNNALEILKDSLLDIAHDLIEDDFLTKEELYELLLKISRSYVDENIAQEISREISQSADRLNSHNFHFKKEDNIKKEKKKSPRNYNVYLNGGVVKYDNVGEETVRPLNFREKFTKIKDMIHNWQTAVKTNKPEKIKVYLKFIAENIHYLELLRSDSINNILKYNLDNLVKSDFKEKSDVQKIRKHLYNSLKEKKNLNKPF